MDNIESLADIIDSIEDPEIRLDVRKSAMEAEQIIDREAVLIDTLTDIQNEMASKGIYKSLKEIRATIKDQETLELLVDVRCLLNYTADMVNKTQR